MTSRRHDAAKENEKTMRIILDNYNLIAAERLLCEAALSETGSIVEAAKLLGITRHGLKRRIIKHNIRWTREGGRIAATPTNTAT